MLILTKGIEKKNHVEKDGESKVYIPMRESSSASEKVSTTAAVLVKFHSCLNFETKPPINSLLFSIFSNRRKYSMPPFINQNRDFMNVFIWHGHDRILVTWIFDNNFLISLNNLIN